MINSTIETDYLVIGSGLTGLAFADTLITESDARITIVDRHGRPGGHWNDAYSFVTLHQPSSFYGVNSLELGSGFRDKVGLNKGMHELAPGPELCGYFDRVMNQRLLPSGRVHYLPLCNHLSNGMVESLLSGARTQVTVRKKTVDATFFSPSVPSTHRPAFQVAPNIRLVPPNALPGLWHSAQENGFPRHFVVIGAGKTAMDACIWLLQCGADPDAIRWIMPRDSWITNRVVTQNAPEFFFEAIGGQANQMEACAKASSVDDLFLRLEACGFMLRIDPDHKPSMFHFATLSVDEVQVLRRIRNIIRQGRVKSLHADHIVMDEGRVAVANDTLFIDCTASAVVQRPPAAVFQSNTIVPGLLRAPLVAFSAALTAYVEVHYDDEAHKNQLCSLVPFTYTLDDYPKMLMANMTNQWRWGKDKALREWIGASRLDGFSKLIAGADKHDTDKQAVIAKLKEQSAAAMANLPTLMASRVGPQVL